MGQEKIHPGKKTPILCNNNTDPTIRINNPAVRLLLWELFLRGFICPVLFGENYTLKLGLIFQGADAK